MIVATIHKIKIPVITKSRLNTWEPYMIKYPIPCNTYRENEKHFSKELARNGVNMGKVICLFCNSKNTFNISYAI